MIYGAIMRRSLGFGIVALALLGACSDSEGAAPSVTAATPAPTTVTDASTTTVAPSTTVEETTTTAAPTGSVQSCEGFLTLDDPDADRWGECIITLEGAQQQYFVISGKINGATATLDLNRAADCAVALQAIQTFIDDLKAAQWPAEVQPALDELVAANEYDLFLRDDNCAYASQAEVDEASLRISSAVFNFRTAIGSPTDF
jgi:hypothetical protein